MIAFHFHGPQYPESRAQGLQQRRVPKRELRFPPNASVFARETREFLDVDPSKGRSLDNRGGCHRVRKLVGIVDQGRPGAANLHSAEGFLLFALKA